MHLSRRNLLAAASAAAFNVAWASRPCAGRYGGGRMAETATPRYVTNFYQFGTEAMKQLAAALPSGKNFLHIMAHSSPGKKPRASLAKMVRAAGASYKFAHPIDVHKYENWETASTDQLKKWAIEFREAALDTQGRADLFAFNEMPTDAPENAPQRAQVAKWLRLLHQAGGGPKLRGLFYLTHRCTVASNWKDRDEPFWEAIDETCDWVVGEHYHDWKFATQWEKQKQVDHLFALPRWLVESGKDPLVRLARDKYIILHSSYYGPNGGNWVGLNNSQYDPPQLKTYFQRLVEATRADEFGAWRISFGPLVTKDLDLRLLDPLCDVLAADVKAFGAR
jgi:hypothetical protein